MALEMSNYYKEKGYKCAPFDADLKLKAVLKFYVLGKINIGPNNILSDR
jgi:hypothetical protein